MSEPSDLAGTSSSAEDAEFDRSAHPALGPLYAELDDLATPPTDADVRLQHISRAAATAALAGASTQQATPWRTVGWRVAAVAAGMAVVVGGLGADDRLPEPAQRMVSSVADTFGVELPDGSDRSTGRDDERPGTTDGRDDGSQRGNSSTTGEDRREDAPRATPAEPGEPGEPATPATPADPDKPERPNEGPPATPQDRPEPPAPTPSSTVPPPPPEPPSTTPPSNPNGADSGGNANENSDGNATEPPAPRSEADAAPDNADRGENSEKSTSKP